MITIGEDMGNVCWYVGVMFLLFGMLLAINVCRADVNTQDFGIFKSAKWIWFPEGNPAESAPRGDVGFYRGFRVKDINQLKQAVAAFSADDEYVLYLNGKRIGSAEGWSKLSGFDILGHLQNGDNLLYIRATNHSMGPAGLLGKIVLTSISDKTTTIVTDSSWLCVRDADQSSTGAQMPAAKLSRAKETVSAGGGPWGAQDWMMLPDTSMNVPSDFPQFIVPGYEKEMSSLRRMYWAAYKNSSAVGFATLWDAWMVSPTLAPAVKADKGETPLDVKWGKVLGARYMDERGYVSSQQHFSHAHDLGWPFPLWAQVAGRVVNNGVTAGWHFNDELPAMMNGWAGVLRGTSMAGKGAIEAWSTDQFESKGLVDGLWQLRTTGSRASITSPENVTIEAFCTPFIQIRLSRTPKPPEAPNACIQWMREGDQGFSAERQIEFSTNGINPWTYKPEVLHCIIPMYQHPLWNGKITRIRFILAEGEDNVTLNLDSIFTAFDTRHSVNDCCYIIGCADYLRWSGDVGFLRSNIDKIRKAMSYNLSELGGAENHLIKCSWTGHDGKPGYSLSADGQRTLYYGHGVGSNYWDLLPFGNEDMYATTYYYLSLLKLAEMEEAIEHNPDWMIPIDRALSADFLRSEAEKVKMRANDRFWNSKAGRFVACVDVDGNPHDYGYTFVNLEAIAYGVASEVHCRSIMRWIDGDRIVEDDTSKGHDIYHWVFAPRTTTRRNIDWYFWGWEGYSVPWGDQVQDGGAVLGFSYHDLISRIRVNGPDDAWKRFRAIAQWYDMVMRSGGVRKYYVDAPGGGHLQGGGVAGGLGVDFEFVETILVPYVLIDGFLGYKPTVTGLEIKPRIPSDWPSLEVTQLRYRQAILDIKVTRKQIVIKCKGSVGGKTNLIVDKGDWKVSEGAALLSEPANCQHVRNADTIGVNIRKGKMIVLEKG